MLLAQTIMKTDVATVHPETSLDKVIDLLIDRTITGLPVVDADGTLLGMITEKDILAFLIDQNVLDLTNNRLLCETTAHHIMTAAVVSCRAETPLLEVCKCLVDHHFRRVPILDADGKLVGIISRKDIIAILS
jgi:CBS domain-containing protein